MKYVIAIFSVIMTTLLFPLSAQAQEVLGACIKACEKRLYICFDDEASRDIKALCQGVKECEGISDNEVSAARALLTACYEGVTKNCPSNCAGSDPPTVSPSRSSPRTAKVVNRPIARQDACKAQGGYYVKDSEGKQLCFTLQGMYDWKQEIEARVERLENANSNKADSDGSNIPQQVQIVNIVINNFREASEGNDDLLGSADRFSSRLNSLEKRIENAEAMASQAMGLAEEVKKSKTARIEPALMGWSVNPYFTFQSFTLYDEFMYAGGLEAGLYPSLSANGRHRAVVVFGGGKAVDYFEMSMLEMHLFGGYRYSADPGSISVGAGTHRYSRTDVQQGRLFWIGPQVEGRLNIVHLNDPRDGLKGFNLYLMGRVGAGYRYGRHGILDPKFEPVQGRFDVPVLFGIGIENVPFL